MDNFFYIIGEAKNAVITEHKEVLQFTREKMGAVDTDELRLVIGNVFGKGEFFPGPDEVVTSIIHEVVRRWDEYQKFEKKNNYCVFISALRKVNGEIDASPLAIVPTTGYQLSEDEPTPFYLLLLDTLPRFQEKFTQKAYATDSKLITVLKDAAKYHQDLDS